MTVVSESFVNYPSQAPVRLSANNVFGAYLTL